MGISSRRLLWGFNCLLLLAAALIFRPFRSWVDQVVVARAIHPDLRVQEIHLHGDRLDNGMTVVEARQFDWSAMYGNRRFGIAAQNAWVVVDNAPLIDKVVSIPKATLQNSKLYIETVPDYLLVASQTNPTTPAQGGSIWRQQLQRRFGEIEWNELKQSLDGVLRLDEFVEQCNQRIESWAAGSEKLASEAVQINSASDALGNPLRDSAELKTRLVKVEQLIQSESELRDQFSTMDAVVQAKLESIGNAFDKTTGLIEHRADRNKVTTRKAITTDLIQQAGGRILTQFKSFGEIADLLCRSSVFKPGYSADEDYRAADQEVLQLGNLSATGVFVDGETRAGFRLQSECNLTTKAPFGSTPRANFRYQFDSNQFTIKVVACSRAHQTEVVDLQLQIVPRSAPAVDVVLEQQADVTVGAAQLVISSHGHGIVGQLCIDELLLPFLVEDNPQLTESLAAELQRAAQTGQPIEGVMLSLGGTWESPTWNLETVQFPTWLENTIDAELEKQRLDNQNQMVARMEKYVTTEIEQLSQSLDRLIDSASGRAEQSLKSIATVQQSLNSLLTDHKNAEFARANDAEVKR